MFHRALEEAERIGNKDCPENGNDEEENNCKMDSGRLMWEPVAMRKQTSL
jgi:hypothetical protein